MVYTFFTNGNIGPFLMASSLLGGFFAPIISYNEFKEAKITVGYICLVVELMASAAIGMLALVFTKTGITGLKKSDDQL